MRTLVSIAGLFCICVVLSACEDTDAFVIDAWGVTSETPVVRNTVAGTRKAATSGWSIDEILRIGAVEGSSPEVFGRITSIAVGSDGRIYVGQLRPAAVKVFDQDGQYVRTLSQQGAGPAEVKWPTGLATDDWDRLWVVDYGNSRFTIFDSTGSLVRSIPRQSGLSNVPWPGAIDESHILDHGGVVHGPGYEEPGWLVALDSLGERRDSIALPAHREKYVPLAPQLIWALGGDGQLWFGVSDTYYLFRMGWHGTVDLVIHLDVPEARVSRAERKAELEGMRARVGAMGGGNVPRFGEVPITRAVIQGIHVDDSGFLWVVPSRARNNDGRVFDIFDRTGTYQGPLQMPFAVASPRPVFRNGYIYAVTRDDLGVHYVVRARIDREGR